VDVFQDHLIRARATGGAFARSVPRPRWGLRLAGTIQLAAHTVVQGSAWLWLDDAKSAAYLRPGEVALVRGGPDHHIAHKPAAMCLEHEAFRMRHLHDDPSDPAASVFVCGAYQFAGDVGLGLINALPQFLILRAPDQDSLHDVIAALAAELVANSPGQQTVLDRLLDVVLVLAIRAGLRRSDTAPGWYCALADARLNAALESIHNDPAHSWAVPELAAISGLSRATFARLFSRMLGQAPMQYLADWRMTLARDLLRTDDAHSHRSPPRSATGHRMPSPRRSSATMARRPDAGVGSSPSRQSVPHHHQPRCYEPALQPSSCRDVGPLAKSWSWRRRRDERIVDVLRLISAVPKDGDLPTLQSDWT
jgi:AraC-like DNA-binding protein